MTIESACFHLGQMLNLSIVIAILQNGYSGSENTNPKLLPNGYLRQQLGIWLQNNPRSML